MVDLSDLQADAWQIAENHGFHDERETECPHCGNHVVDTRGRPEVLALIHSEVTEALEADRNGEGDEAYAEELADIIIRVLDHAHSEGFDMEAEVTAKNDTNRGRDRKHGKDY